MHWDKTLIEIKNLPGLRAQLQDQIQTANPAIEKIRCLFGYKDKSTIYIYTAFDFLDQYQSILEQGILDKFYVYQPLSEN